jgi:hypothetical protein
MVYGEDSICKLFCDKLRNELKHKSNCLGQVEALAAETVRT